MTHTVQQRVLACLRGLATGDAIGKQTEMLSHADVRRWYPHGVRGFEGEPGAVIPRYADNRKRQWRIGETTDDTERTIAVARAIVQDGDVRHESIGREMLTCTKCIHPGLTSLWEFHQAGDSARTTDQHDGCGAAVRVAPVGILYRSSRIQDLAAASREASISTHGGPLALAAAAATATAISAAIDGAAPDEIVELAVAAAGLAEWQRTGVPIRGRFAAAIVTKYGELSQDLPLTPAVVAEHNFPEGPLHIAPLAIALGALMESAEEATLLAANVGGDSDSVASIAGAILGARFPDTVNDDWCAVVESVNGHDFSPLAERLSRLRG
jgi:ADP-ribosylglycohydrolase